MYLEHKSVLLNESIPALNINPQGVYVDGTFGRGGHSRAILQQLNSQGTLIVFDKDPEAIALAQEWSKTDPRIKIAHASFAELSTTLQHLNIPKVDGVLLDLGISSPQIDEPERGFSFRFDAPLDMRMDNSQGQTASEWLATATEAEISAVLRDFGEERFHRRIASRIIEARQTQAITTTADLATLCQKAIPTYEKQHPATRTFQAIRIFINHELDDLQQALPQIIKYLNPHGRMVIISFHSLEDRIVKQFIRTHSTVPSLPKWVHLREADLPTPPLKAIGKAIRASTVELQDNPRARSAILRVAERTLGELK